MALRIAVVGQLLILPVLPGVAVPDPPAPAVGVLTDESSSPLTDESGSSITVE